MENGFEVILECLRHAKKATIEQSVSFGRKYPILKYPLFVLVVAFVFVYDFFLHFFIKVHAHGKLSKALAYILSVALILSSVSVSALADDENNSIKITAFSSLSEDVAVQNLYVGDEESKISFPSSLVVTVEKTEVVTIKKEVTKEKESEIAEESKTQDFSN